MMKDSIEKDAFGIITNYDPRHHFQVVLFKSMPYVFNPKEEKNDENCKRIVRLKEGEFVVDLIIWKKVPYHPSCFVESDDYLTIPLNDIVTADIDVVNVDDAERQYGKIYRGSTPQGKSRLESSIKLEKEAIDSINVELEEFNYRESIAHNAPTDKDL